MPVGSELRRSSRKRAAAAGALWTSGRKGVGAPAILPYYWFIGGTVGAGGLGAAERLEPGGRAEGGREGSERRFFCRPLVPDGRGERGRDNR